jgi:hypothetical protein
MGLPVPDLPTGGHHSTTINNHQTERIAQKEKSHVVDCHRNSVNPVAARLSRWKHKPKLPENRQLDSYFDRNRCDPHHFARVGNHITSCFVENNRGGQRGRLFINNTRKQVPNVIYHRDSSDNTVFAWLLAIKPTTLTITDLGESL